MREADSAQGLSEMPADIHRKVKPRPVQTARASEGISAMATTMSLTHGTRVDKVEAARAAAREHVETCATCARGLAAGDEPLELCGIGWTLWARFELERDLAAEHRIEVVFVRGAAGDGRLGMHLVGDFTVEEAVLLHDWLGNHRLGCADDSCLCWAAGYEAGLEERRRP